MKLLDNIMWHTLTGPHSRYASGAGGARRYAAGFSPLLGFENPASPDFGALAGCCNPDEHFYCAGWSGSAPADWQVDAETTMFKMVWEARIPDAEEAPDAVRLGPEHVQRALDFGYFDGLELVAMAGERMFAGVLREISGVCTHPKFQGRGLARRLMLKLVRRQMLRGETPFLHVMRENGGARQLYERMGFRNYMESVVRVVSPR